MANRVMAPLQGGTADVVVPFEPKLAPLSSVRSTLLISSLETLKELGHHAAYFAQLSPPQAETIRSLVAATWVPVDVAAMHYTACDRLGLLATEQVEIGRRVGLRIQDTFGTILAIAKGAGATPWTYLAQLGRLHSRIAVGGGVAVYRVSAKEAIMEFAKVPIFRIPYFRNALRGVHQSLADLFCTKAYAKVRSCTADGMSISYTIAWA
jgi:hypothetical protein